MQYEPLHRYKVSIYGTAQRQLESRGQTTRAVWNLYLRMRVRVQAHTHATSYLLRVISTNDKNTSLSSSILRVSLLVYVHTHIVKSQSRTFLLCILVAVSIVLTGKPACLSTEEVE